MNAWKKSKGVLVGVMLTLTLGVLLGASNIVQNWSWDKSSQWFSVLLKDGGGTKFVSAAPKQYLGVDGGAAANVGCAFSSTTLANMAAAGDIELDSKPIWTDAN